jgi:hypothetical protein
MRGTRKLKAFAALLFIIAAGCRPSVREIVSALEKAPLGINRDQLGLMLVDEVEKKKGPHRLSDYILTAPLRSVTPEMLKADLKLISFFEEPP